MTIRRWDDVETLGTIDYSSGWNQSYKGYDVTGLTDGGYVVAGIDNKDTGWRDDDSGHFQVFDANGTAQTGMIALSPPSNSPVVEIQVAGLENGNFAAIYTTDDPLGTKSYIDIREPDGTLVTTIAHNTGGTRNEDPSIVAVEGGFVVGYSDQARVFLRSYDLEGNSTSGFISVSGGVVGSNEMMNSSLAVNNLGDRVGVTWTDHDAGGDAEAIRFRLYDTDLSNPTPFSTVTSTFSSATGPNEIVAQDESEFSVVFSRRDGDASDIRSANIFADGTGNGNMVVNSLTNDSQISPSTVGLSNGSTMVTWSDFAFAGQSRINGRSIEADNTEDGRQVRLDLPEGGVSSLGAQLAELSDGRVAMVWASGGELHHQILDSREGIVDGDLTANELYGNKQLSDQIVGYAGDDRLLGLAGNDSLYGGADDDILYGNNGDDALYGGTGNDILAGGRGADIHAGGEGVDTVYYLDATSGVTASLANNQINKGWADGDTWFDVENLTGSNFDDLLYGQAGGLANTIRGGGGDDLIKGYSGDDILYGNADDDVLDGGLGADLLAGGSGLDIASYEGATTGVIAALSNTSLNSGEANGDTYNSIEGLRGSRYNDILNGSNSADVLEGWGGNDLLKGYRGFDTLTGGGGADTFIFASSLGAANLAEITDFQESIDTIRLYDEVFTNIGSSLSGSEFRSNSTGQAQDSTDRIIYNENNGYMYYDSDGAGGSGRVYFAKLDAGLELGASDFEVV